MSSPGSRAGLREKRNMLLSGGDGVRAGLGREQKEPQGGQVPGRIHGPGRLSPPWCPEGGGAEWPSVPSRPEGQEDVPPTASNLLLSTTIMLPLTAPGLIFGDDKRPSSKRGRGHVCMWRFGLLPNIELVAVLLGDLRADEQ